MLAARWRELAQCAAGSVEWDLRFSPERKPISPHSIF
jgi:hypothetical protein